MQPGKHYQRFLITLGILVLIYWRPFLDLIQFSLGSDLYSHVILIPLVSAYLARLRFKDGLPEPSRSPLPALWFGLGGVAVMLLYALTRWNGWLPPMEDYLCVTLFSFLLLLVSACLYFLGGPSLRALLFPVCLLAFLMPFPKAVEAGLEIFFQHTSAEVSYWFLKLTNTPVFRQDLAFKLPGISIEVARECSGIRSSLVLFITSLIAGDLFLKSPWRKSVLALFIVPLAIVRNALRILTISLLCVHVDPTLIDSVIHHRGGPVFFGLSLVPFFALLWYLRRSESKRPGDAT